MSVSDALDYWKGLEAMAGAGAKIHLSGGEPFGNWRSLLAILREAHAQGLCAHELETNAFWCTEAAEVDERCRQLAQLELGRLVVSCDIYHQRYIPVERVRLLVRVAGEVLGPERVRIRWRDFFSHPVDISDLSTEQCGPAYRQAWQNHKDRLTGRAAAEISPLLPKYELGAFAGQNCRKAILASRHVHIDAAGNVFPGVCSGVVVGNARENSLAQLWDLLVNTEDPILRTLIEQGPYGLARVGAEFGYEPGQDGFAGKCHLCSQVRRFLFDSGKFAPTIGPEQCYYEN